MLGQVLYLDPFTLGQIDGRLNGGFEFADIARPIVFHEPFQCFRRHPGTAAVLIVLFEKRVDQQGNIVDPGPQRR